MNNWPPQFGFQADLPASHQGMFDPGNDLPEEILNEDGDDIGDADKSDEYRDLETFKE